VSRVDLYKIAEGLIALPWCSSVRVSDEMRYTKPNEVEGKHLRPEIYIHMIKGVPDASLYDTVIEALTQTFPFLKFSKSFYKQYDTYLWLQGWSDEPNVMVKVVVNMPDSLFSELAGCDVVETQHESQYSVYSCKVK